MGMRDKRYVKAGYRDRVEVLFEGNTVKVFYSAHYGGQAAAFQAAQEWINNQNKINQA